MNDSEGTPAARATRKLMFAVSVRNIARCGTSSRRVVNETIKEYPMFDPQAHCARLIESRIVGHAARDTDRPDALVKAARSLVNQHGITRESLVIVVLDMCRQILQVATSVQFSKGGSKCRSDGSF